MPRVNRRSAMRVRDGRVQKKNNWVPAAGDYRALPQDEIALDRRKPAAGHRHLITTRQLRDWLDLLPDWDEVAVGVRAVVLDSDTDCYGYYQAGVVALCNWPHELWELISPGILGEFVDIVDLLGVERVPAAESYELREFNETLERLGQQPLDLTRSNWMEVRWTEAQARAFQLVYVLPHELGHHHDRMTTRSRRRVARGEPYAEAYARRALDVLWPAYAAAFGV